MQESKSGRLRKLTAFAAATAVASAGAVALVGGIGGSAAAAADPSTYPVHKDFAYKCNFPAVGTKDVAVHVDANIPLTQPAGVETGALAIHSVSTLDGATTSAMRIAGVRTLDGKAAASSPLNLNGADLGNVNIGLPIATYTLPASGVQSVIVADGQAPSLTFDDPGSLVVGMTTLILNMNAYNSAGASLNATLDSTDPNGYTMEHIVCDLGGVSGAKATLATVTVTGGSTPTPTSTVTPTPTPATPTPTATPATPTPTATPATPTPTATPATPTPTATPATPTPTATPATPTPTATPATPTPTATPATPTATPATPTATPATPTATPATPTATPATPTPTATSAPPTPGTPTPTPGQGQHLNLKFTGTGGGAGLSLPFNGTASIDVASSGAITGTAAVPAVTFYYNLFGWLPVVGKLGITTGPITGAVTGGKIGLSVPVSLSVDSAKLLGVFPLVGKGCKSAPSTLALTQTSGLSLSGSMKFPSFTGCGELGQVINLLAGAPVKVDISAKQK